MTFPSAFQGRDLMSTMHGKIKQRSKKNAARRSPDLQSFGAHAPTVTTTPGTHQGSFNLRRRHSRLLLRLGILRAVSHTALQSYSPSKPLLLPIRSLRLKFRKVRPRTSRALSPYSNWSSPSTTLFCLDFSHDKALNTPKDQNNQSCSSFPWDCPQCTPRFSSSKVVQAPAD